MRASRLGPPSCVGALVRTCVFGACAVCVVSDCRMESVDISEVQQTISLGNIFTFRIDARRVGQDIRDPSRCLVGNILCLPKLVCCVYSWSLASTACVLHALVVHAVG